MQIKTFLLNVTKLAKAPSLSNQPPLEVSQSDMKELVSYLEEENVPHNIVGEQEMNFQFSGINFQVIENDRNEEVGLAEKVIDPQKWVADLSEEDQKVVKANTDAAGAIVPPTSDPDAVEKLREGSIPTEGSPEEQQAELKEKEQSQADKTADKAKPTKPAPVVTGKGKDK